MNDRNEKASLEHSCCAVDVGALLLQHPVQQRVRQHGTSFGGLCPQRIGRIQRPKQHEELRR